jgi:two-component system, LytTR family, sensor kinase
MREILKRLVSGRIFQHSLFWIVYSLFFTFIAGWQWIDFVSVIIGLPPIILGAYIISYLFIPRLILKKKYVFGILLIIISFLVVLIMDIFITQFIIIPLTISEVGEIYYPNLINFITWEGVPIFLFIAIKLLKNWFTEQLEREKLAKVNLQSELQLLKAQLHPHFLFNTLNNMYYLALEKSDKTPILIEKTSRVLRSVLYECNTPKIKIGQELQLIEDFIDIEKIRYNENFKLDFKKDIQDKGVQISPLILFTFVENSFKHGVSDVVENQWIELSVEANDKQLHFSISNSKSEDKSKDEMDYRNGIGLRNVKRRLHLLYPKRHQLSIKSSSDKFVVDLSIQLKN